MANKPVVSKDADKIYRKILLENIAQIIAHFKSVFKDNPEKIATSKRYIEQFSAKLKSASTERSVNRYTGEVETSDADDYAFYIAQEEQNISKLQSQLDLLVLLNNAFDKQLKIFIVSHNPLLLDEVNDFVKIERDENGFSVIKQ